MDVRAEILNCDLNDHIWLEKAERFVDHSQLKNVWKLQKVLYDLKHANMRQDCSI